MKSNGTPQARPQRRTIRDALRARKAARVEEHRDAKTATLNALQAQRTGKHVYAGTVPAHVVAKRRARNKVAKASRRANR